MALTRDGELSICMHASTTDTCMYVSGAGAVGVVEGNSFKMKEFSLKAAS